MDARFRVCGKSCFQDPLVQLRQPESCADFVFSKIWCRPRYTAVRRMNSETVNRRDFGLGLSRCERVAFVLPESRAPAPLVWSACQVSCLAALRLHSGLNALCPSHHFS